MSDPTQTLVEFLLARITEDEADAYRAARFRYDQPTDSPWASAASRVEHGVALSADRHSARWSPARVLAECAAHREIVEHAQRWALTLNETPEGWTEELTTPYRMAMRWTLEQLAQPYSGHPDFGAVFGD